MSDFISDLAPSICSMLDYREALGFSRKSHEAKLHSIDRYCAANYHNADTLSKEMVLGWLEEQHSAVNSKATTVRILGEYLTAIGKESYVLHHKYFSERSSPSAYIFTDDELTALFNAVDNIKPTNGEPFLPEIASVMFRLIYTCGLRPNEGRELKRENINFKTGEILITNTKWKKERRVVMSNDMLVLCRNYDVRREVIARGNEWFFPSWTGGSFRNHQIGCYFRECWARANPSINKSELPGVRVYDLRYRFASAALNRWLDNNQPLGAKLPYLMAYMGHSSLSETAYYIHLLPENLVKSAGIDWAAFDEIVPEVTLWEG